MSEQELEAKNETNLRRLLTDNDDVTPSAITSESSSPNDEESSSDPQSNTIFIFIVRCKHLNMFICLFVQPTLVDWM